LRPNGRPPLALEKVSFGFAGRLSKLTAQADGANSQVRVAEACLRQIGREWQAVARIGHFDFSLKLRDGSFESRAVKPTGDWGQKRHARRKHRARLSCIFPCFDFLNIVVNQSADMELPGCSTFSSDQTAHVLLIFIFFE